MVRPTDQETTAIEKSLLLLRTEGLYLSFNSYIENLTPSSMVLGGGEVITER